uniref:Uncharacterized protein n=1 Tax=Lactuca sativa TaxID=4236 RepID=A0A9R1WL06_LACSA|nr:hypothetical protein LSAT_V11C100011640 [Lactuca sativa]
MVDSQHDMFPSLAVTKGLCVRNFCDDHHISGNPEGCSRYILSSQYLTSHQKEGFKDMFVVFGIILDYWLLDLLNTSNNNAIHMSWVLLHSQLLCNKLLYMQIPIQLLQEIHYGLRVKSSVTLIQKFILNKKFYSLTFALLEKVGFLGDNALMVVILSIVDNNMWCYDPHALSFNLSSSIGSTTKIPILFPEDYEAWALHFEDYVLGIIEHGSTIWQTITQETFTYLVTIQAIKTLADYNALIIKHNNVPNDEKNKLMCNIKAMRIIQFALPPYTFRLDSACDTAKGIWDRLKDLYSCDADLEHTMQTLLLSEFGAFVQKYDENLD